MEETLARHLCDTYYLTVDPVRPLKDAYDKVTERTREHWRAQAALLIERGWRDMSATENKEKTDVPM